MPGFIIMHALLLAALVLSGCGHSEDKTQGFPNRLKPAIAADGTKTFRRGNSAEPQSLDPAQVTGVPGANILYDLYEGLVTLSPEGKVIPGVARSWDVSDDGLTYTFHLDRQARWSNGQPVTAQDFVFSLRRAVDPAIASPYADMHEPIAHARAIMHDKAPVTKLGVKALDKRTLEIRLAERTPFFIATLAHVSSYPVYPPAVKQWGDAFTQPRHAVTNGAYRLASWRVNNKIVLKRNRHYRDDRHTRIDRVVYYPIDDKNAELARYQAGDLDFTYSVPNAKLDAVNRYIPKQNHAVPGLGTYYFGFNVTRPPFKDNPKLRMALSLALDREVLTRKILRGGQPAAYSFIPEDMPGYTPVQYPWADWSQARREKLARRLYRQAGYSPDKPLEARLLYPTSKGNKQIAIVAAEMWRRVLGARIIPWNQEWKVYLSTANRKEETEIFYGGWIGDYQDPDTFLAILHSESGNNRTGYANAEFDALQEKSAHMASGEKRHQAIQAAEKLILRDNPYMPIYFIANHHLIKPYVTGFVGNPLDIYPTRYLDIKPENSARQSEGT